MPTISEFLGIKIAMNFADHNPPHIHAFYSGTKGAICLKSYKLLNGDLPPRITKYVIEWMKKHKNALNEMWNTKNIQKLPPLI